MDMKEVRSTDQMLHNIGQTQLGLLVETIAKGYRPFSLGPLYVFGGVDFSILGRYVEETKAELMHQTIDVGQDIFVNLKDWNNHIELIPEPFWTAFQNYMKTITLRDKDDNDSEASVYATKGMLLHDTGTIELDIFSLTSWSGRPDLNGKLLRPANGHIAVPRIEMKWISAV